MEGTDKRKTLRMKYSKKVTDVVYEGVQEEPLSSNFEIINKDNSEELSSLEGEEQMNLSKFKESSLDKFEQFTKEIEQLNFELQQKNLENGKYQTQLDFLQTQLDDNEKIILSQEKQLIELNSILAVKNKETEVLRNDIALIKNSIIDKEEKICKLKEAAIGNDCTFEELYQAVCRMRKQCSMLSAEIEEERAKFATTTEEIFALNDSLSEEQKIVKGLETFLSEEAAKSKKLQRELEFLINHVNKEKEELQKEFENFRDATTMFIENFNEHKDVILKEINTEIS